MPTNFKLYRRYLLHSISTKCNLYLWDVLSNALEAAAGFVLGNVGDADLGTGLGYQFGADVVGSVDFACVDLAVVDDLHGVGLFQEDQVLVERLAGYMALATVVDGRVEDVEVDIAVSVAIKLGMVN